MKYLWLSLCTVWPSHSQISSLSLAILALGKAKSRREANLGCRGADRTGRCDILPKKSLHESCKMGRRIVVMKLICTLCYCECDSHTVYKLSERRLIADWLAPRESDCSRIHSKVSSDWLPGYINATWPVLEIFKLSGYFPDSPRMYVRVSAYVCVCMYACMYVCMYVYRNVCMYICMYVCMWTELYVVPARRSLFHFYLTVVVVSTIFVSHVRIFQFITE